MANKDELKKLEEEKVGILQGSLIGNVPQTPFGVLGCQHCYCGRGSWNTKEHLVCCICGHRTLANPISY